ncbi:MAG: hypothetical protein LBE35_09705 [Clostridiales bacterium]|jgi:hypothetical protein|nr:hypothetical protein [Clostridiales bacterium]
MASFARAMQGDGTDLMPLRRMGIGLSEDDKERFSYASMPERAAIIKEVAGSGTVASGYRITQSAMFNLGGHFTWLNGNIGRVDGTSAINATINIFVDDRLVDSFEQNALSLPKNFRIFVEGGRNLRMETITIIGANQTMTYAFTGFAE